MSSAAANPDKPSLPLQSRQVPPSPSASGTSRSRNRKAGSSPTYLVVTGNPNCGKTTLFNGLTGLRAKVGNYAGVTVERKEGRLLGAPADLNIRVLDLPGTYSLSPHSLDEQISRDVLLHRLPDLPAPALILVVVDASNLQRNLYYATQVIELAYPTVVALNMMDVAEANGHLIDTAKLALQLGVPVLPIVASSGKGIPELRSVILETLRTSGAPAPRTFLRLTGSLESEITKVASLLCQSSPASPGRARAEALLLLTQDHGAASASGACSPEVREEIAATRQRLDATGHDWRAATIEGRYQQVASIQRAVTTEVAAPGENFSDRLDRVLTHKVWGTLAFFLVMLVMFQGIFTFARIPMDLLQRSVDALGSFAGRIIPPGDLNSLLVDGVIAGVGAVVVFLPQILLLFLFIGFLEDTGYMARAAFLMDRIMTKVGLHGKSFIPLLSSFACAIPGIMATRTIESPKDRLATILVAPLMSCSARLPVYTLLISACIPNMTVLGFLKLSALTMLGMYLLGIVTALALAWTFKRTLLKAEPPLLILELPPYKRPLLKVVLRHMWDRVWIFLKQAGTIILGINILLWFLATYPRNSALDKDFAAKRETIAAGGQSVGSESIRAQLAALDQEAAGVRLRNSFAGRLGRLIEPAIAPLGFDWKIGIGIVSSFAAREVFVSTMSTVYNVGKGDSGETTASLAQTLRAEKRPDGTPVYTTLTAVTLMVFYVFALQCVSTVAIVRRETNSWKWPLFQWTYLATLAWTMSFLTHQIGRWLGG
jgi:ferrous iron transport protein B